MVYKITFMMFLMLAFIWHCSNKGVEVAGPVTVVGNPKVAFTGIALDGSGNPVESAKVYVYKISAATNVRFPNTPEIVDSANTDSEGQFLFSGLRSGIYALDGSLPSENLYASINGINFDSTQILTITLVLKKPGIIKGVINYDYPISNSFVLVNVEGLYKRNHLMMADNQSGEYELSNVPEGYYTIGFFSYDYKTRFLDSVYVASGSILTLDTIVLQMRPDLPPPIPTGFTAEYDTGNAVVVLQWNPVQLSKLLGYRVIRKIQPGEINNISTVLTDTTYIDSVAGIPKGSSVIYLVKAVDKAYNESQNAGPIEIVIKN